MAERKIVDYEIITFCDFNTTVKMVKAGIHDGWQPLGSLQTNHYVNEDGATFGVYSQAMVKYQSEEEVCISAINEIAKGAI